MKDKEIIDLYWSRDPSAIVVSSKQYGAYCHQIAWNILHNMEDCEECINETWFRAWNAMPDARPDYLASFFGTITRRLSLDCYRKNRAWKRGGGEVALVYDELRDCMPQDSFTPGQLSDSSKAEISDNNIEAHLNAIVLTDALNAFLEKLDRNHRILFVRRYWYADSIKDLAYHFHYSESRVKSILFRTRKKLKQHLEKEGITI